MRTLIITGIIVIVGLIVLSQTLYIVDETEQVIITRFGEVQDTINEPGLNVKAPFVDTVVRFDKRLLRIDADPETMRDANKENLSIDSYARYRITNPVQFRKTLLTESNARSRLGDIVNATLRENIALLKRPQIIGANFILDSAGNQVVDVEGLPLIGGTESRTELLAKVLSGVRARTNAQEVTAEFTIPAGGDSEDFQIRIEDSVILPDDISVVSGPDGEAALGVDVLMRSFSEGLLTLGAQEGEKLTIGASFTVQYFVARDEPFGIEIVDVRIKRADFPDTVTPSIYTRMRAERNRIATKFRAEGDEQDLQIRAGADKERDIILADADRTANEVRGQGEADAIRILADALEQDPEFFSFRRSLEAYKTFLNQRTTVILSSDADVFKFLQSPGEGAANPN
ncbi:MAG: protease modulator HflC [Chloroflexi bacterium]|nr:protease modulator HflC [Chloroflexota bacterium]